MAAVELVNIEKSYGMAKVIHDVNLSIEDGEFIALVGASGCGKSTLLRMIAGLETITGGTVSIGGRVVNDVPSKDRDIAMVFQNYALYPHLTVAENMGFSLKLRGVSAAERRRAVEQTADILGLGKLLDRYPKQLSGGQRQRVAMGRAIVRHPHVFLFDEPLSNLDAKLRVQMRVEIKALQQRLATTSIYVTHDQMEAMTMPDRIVILNEGRVEQIGAPLDLYDRPANLFVAGFIGSPAMNILNGRLKRADGGAFVESGGLALPVAADPEIAEGRPVSWGLRPEHCRVGDGPGALPFTVDLVEATGADSHLYGKVAGETFVAVVPGRVSARTGDVLPLAVADGAAHLFDTETGRRL
ncbi:ABC transporter ATP-binding protein [Segnochrobactrum spirostomi]|uniref:sn-glycerol-3-phosphate ABC transporter ATP-binding protein UgpC n=1 Tax=Segnochrobactrum spirostomi TaxID=2608987 RepID=A0A6A7YBJ1_9HYPH|nr:sn-glycerol-3-phosphate ABC transporter ATP-binding protein UgpC [Segnochrobactrum spirostomi]MQT15338.1 sn-glycerol-3-phosphate ABC transporter ATP-binding protein UgpC [Segnochrobactrum spirostomi]